MAALLSTALFMFLLVQNSAAVDETELASIVTQLFNAYRPTHLVHSDTPTFTLAASVPFNPATRRYDVAQVTAADNSQNVKTTLNGCGIYQGSRVMGAMVLKWPDVKVLCPNAVIPASWTFVRELCPNVVTWADLRQECTNRIQKKLQSSPNGASDHAEYRVLQNFNHFTNLLNTGRLNRNDLLVFFSYKSPCDTRCASITNTWSILPSITSINNWPNHVLAFSQIFEPARTAFSSAQLETNRRTALTNIGNAIGGLGNVFRCPVGSARCSNCRGQTGQPVTDACVSNTVRSRSPSPNGK